MAARGPRSSLCIVAMALCAVLGGCAQYDVGRLAGDETAGRDNGTPGSARAIQFLIGELKPISTGLNTAGTGDAAYAQSLPGGTNVVSVIPGTDLADQYVVVGAHYDHRAARASTSRRATRSATGPPTTRPGRPPCSPSPGPSRRSP